MAQERFKTAENLGDKATTPWLQRRNREAAMIEPRWRDANPSLLGGESEAHLKAADYGVVVDDEDRRSVTLHFDSLSGSMPPEPK